MRMHWFPRPGASVTGRRMTAVTIALAVVTFAAMWVAMPPAQAGIPHAAASTDRRVPGLVHPLRVPQRVRNQGQLLAASKAVIGQPARRRPEHLSAVIREDLAAAAQARRTGKPVVVPSETTETMEVLAHPDGRFEFISNAMPVRVLVQGRWTPISTTLRRGPSGTWTAPLTSSPVTFSGGGTGPLAVATDPATGRSVSVSWPYRLPRPEVSGSVALYPDVLPGVDLRLQATATGYQEVLIIGDAAAAADPRLRSLTFTLRGGPGVTIRRGLSGAVIAVDSATGKTLFTSGRPMAWDSSDSG